MNDNNNSSVIENCIDFIQQSKQEIDIGDSPFTEGDREISYGIAEERIFPIPVCDVSRKLAFVDGGTALILSAADFNISLSRVAKFNANIAKVGYWISYVIWSVVGVILKIHQKSN